MIVVSVMSGTRIYLINLAIEYALRYTDKEVNTVVIILDA